MKKQWLILGLSCLTLFFANAQTKPPPKWLWFGCATAKKTKIAVEKMANIKRFSIYTTDPIFYMFLIRIQLRIAYP
jgi:hypothetical protein